MTNADWHREVRDFAQGGERIRATQVLTKHGLTLREAKDLMETLQKDPSADVQILVERVMAARFAGGGLDDKAARLQQQIQRLSLPSQLLGRKELRELPAILWDDEELLDVVQGFYNNGTGILVSTQKRLVFVDKGMIYGLKVEDFPLDKISSIQYETGMLLGSITIFTSGNKAIIKNVDKTKARTFAEGVRARIASKPSAPPPQAAPQVAAGPSDLSAELEKLGSLRERGLLSDEEFAAAKRRLLGV